MIEDVIVNQGIEALGRYYSRYRGIVVDNDDPLSMNRLKVAIPDIDGGIILWAEPIGQHGSVDSGFKYLTPKIKDLVWVSFECGNPSKPLWEYLGWGVLEIPQELAKPNTLGFITPNGNKVFLDEDDGELIVSVHGSVIVQSIDGDIQLKSKGSIFLDPDEGLFVHDGSNGGVINIDQLTDKLNNLQQELERLRGMINSHTHTCSSQGNISSPPIVQHTQAFSRFNKDDYEDTTFLH